MDIFSQHAPQKNFILLSGPNVAVLVLGTLSLQLEALIAVFRPDQRHLTAASQTRKVGGIEDSQ